MLPIDIDRSGSRGTVPQAISLHAGEQIEVACRAHNGYLQRRARLLGLKVKSAEIGLLQRNSLMKTPKINQTTGCFKFYEKSDV